MNLNLNLDNEIVSIIVTKKRTTKNTYLRFKEDLKLHVTCNLKTSDQQIISLINKELPKIKKMYYEMKKRVNYQDFNYYLGKEFIVIKTNHKTYYEDNRLFLNQNDTIEKWYKKEAKRLFYEKTIYWHNEFTYKLPKISLKIRKMKTRWGVCNTKDKVITLNLELIKKDISALDYVIVHELAHLIHADHSASFWQVVADNYPDYKKVRKYLNNYEEDL